MTKIVLWNENVFVMIFVAILAVIIISFYVMIRPQKSNIPYNFNPFPDVAPTELPDPSHLNENCWNTLTKCDSNGECSQCGQDYECTTLTKDDPPHFFNGIPVPINQPYCLKKKIGNPECNTYTGRWLWVADPDYCSSLKPGETQCWKCECIYPGMFSGPGCTEQQVCKNYSQEVNPGDQTNNQLYATPYAPSEIQGKPWDPVNAPDNDILQYPPDTVDKEGNPWFACQCNASPGGQFFGPALPNDPYNCHLDPCYGYYGWNQKGLVCNLQGDCECPECGTNSAKSPNGRWANTCVSISGSCGKYNWDSRKQECMCDVDNGYFPLKCRSDMVNTDDPSLPKCSPRTYTTNALGSECINPCENPANQCLHQGQCIPKSATDAECNCAASPHVGDFIWRGKKCDKLCLPDGVATYSGGAAGSSRCYNSCCCCSKATKRKYVMWYTDYIDYCQAGGDEDQCPNTPIGGPGTDSKCVSGPDSKCS